MCFFILKIKEKTRILVFGVTLKEMKVDP